MLIGERKKKKKVKIGETQSNNKVKKTNKKKVIRSVLIDHLTETKQEKY